MKTSLTEPGRPRDIIERWSIVEVIVTGEVEAKVRSLTRHVILGCSVCRQDEIISALRDVNVTVREALFLIDVLAVQYILSEPGKQEVGKLYAGLIPALLHDDNGPLTNDGYLNSSFEVCT